MQLLRAIVTLSLLLLGTGHAMAECECLWKGAFSDVQADTQLVLSGTVLSTKGNSIDLLINRTLRGEIHSDDVRIWLQTADYCRPPVSEFPVGSQWVMALHKITKKVPGGFNPNTPSVSYGRVGDYRLSSCGGYWLSQSEQWVSGNLIQAPRWVREPKMTPVLLDLLAQYVDGEVPAEALLQASKEDPALRELMLDTRAFLRDAD